LTKSTQHTKDITLQAAQVGVAVQKLCAAKLDYEECEACCERIVDTWQITHDDTLLLFALKRVLAEDVSRHNTRRMLATLVDCKISPLPAQARPLIEGALVRSTGTLFFTAATALVQCFDDGLHALEGLRDQLNTQQQLRLDVFLKSEAH